jgi:DNA polymerase-1
MSHHVVIDGNSVAHWQFWRAPQEQENGREVGMLRAVGQWLAETKANLNAYSVRVCFDSKKNWRYEVLPTYKGHRTEKHPALAEQLAALPQWLYALGWATEEQEGYEADDLCAAFANPLLGERVTVVSTDKDLCQLVDDARGIKVFCPLSGTMFDEAAVVGKFNVPPYRLREWLALNGDTADNVKGVPGWGKKTAAQAINETLDLEHLLEQSKRLKLSVSERLQKTLNSWHAQLRIDYEVVGFRVPDAVKEAA